MADNATIYKNDCTQELSDYISVGSNLSVTCQDSSVSDDFTTADISVTERITEVTCLCLICFIAVVGNLSLWVVIMKDKSLRISSNYLMLSLSGADLMVGCLNVPVVASNVVLGRWSFVDGACVVFGVIQMTLFISSVMSLAMISVNRYFLIVNPNKYRTIYTKRNTCFIAIGIWLFAACLASPPLFGWGRYGYLPGQSICFCQWTTSISYTFFMVGVCFGGPCSAMTFCYFKILQEVRLSRRRLQENGADARSEANQGTNADPSNENETSGGLSTNRKTKDKDVVFVVTGPGSNIFSKHDNSKPRQEPKLRMVSVEDSSTQSIVDPATNTHKDWLRLPERRRVSRGSRILLVSDMASNASSVASTPGAPSKQQQKKKKNEKKRAEELKLTVTFLVVISAFITLWLPFCITMFISVLSDTPVPRIPDMITLILGCANSCCNPIIYGVMNTKFRNGYSKLYCSLCRRYRSGVSPLDRDAEASVFRSQTCQ